MGKSINNISDSVRLALHKYSDDIKLPKSLVKDKIRDIRAAIIRDEIESRKSVSTGFYQLVSCLKIEKRKTECVLHGAVLSGYKVNVTGIFKGIRDPVLFIGSHNLNQRYDILELVPFLSHGNSAHTSKIPVCTLIEEDVLFNTLPMTAGEYLTGLILFEDFDAACGFSDEDDIPVPRTIIYKLEMLVKKDILASYGYLYDPLNDNSEEQMKSKAQSQQPQTQRENDGK